jgi:hypothetical protein
MRTLKYTYWQDGDFSIGFLNDYPDYSTQGTSRDELVENLKDLLVNFESGELPSIRQVDELLVASMLDWSFLAEKLRGAYPLYLSDRHFSARLGSY